MTAVLAAPREIWVAVAAAVGFILLFAVVNAAGSKISMHAGRWVTHWAFLGIVISPWWWLMLILTPVVAWSRLKRVHHPRTELLGGVLAAAVVVRLALPAL